MLRDNDLQAVADLSQAAGRIATEMGKAIVGQQEVIRQLLVVLFSGGHCLLEGVPGLAKTLMIRSLADTLSLEFSRIQFTPDLMPSDITGTEIIQEDKATGERGLRFLAGPVFANVVLADEINRTPPKTQAALLESMQERQVTVGGERRLLPSPFFVLATQNPIEQEGTYPLPEAQRDRFMFHVLVDYPSEADELEIVMRTTADLDYEIDVVMDAVEVEHLFPVVRKIPIAEHLARYALRLARATRPDLPSAPGFVRQYIAWGAGPRASQYLVLGAKSRAALDGRHFVTEEDIRAVAAPVLRHRIITNFNADAEGMSNNQLIHQLLDTVSVVSDDSGPNDSGPNDSGLDKESDAIDQQLFGTADAS